MLHSFSFITVNDGLRLIILYTK